MGRLDALDLSERIGAKQYLSRLQAAQRRLLPAADPLKAWKLTDDDWRNRQRNRDYDAAAEDLSIRTDHELR